MRLNGSKLTVPAVLVLTAAALSGCSSSGSGVSHYRSEDGFGAGDRFGSHLFASQAPPRKTAAVPREQPTAPKTTTVKSTARVSEQNAD